MISKIIAQHFEFYEENDEQFLRMDITHEDDCGIYQTHIDKVRFNFSVKNLEVINDDGVKSGRVLMHTTNPFCCNDMYFDIRPDSNGNLFIAQIIEEKVHEMTLEEIEKKLGKKIKIVTAKENKTVKKLINGCGNNG